MVFVWRVWKWCCPDFNAGESCAHRFVGELSQRELHILNVEEFEPVFVWS